MNGTGVPALDDLVSAATVDTVLGEAKAVFGDSITGLTFTQQIGDSVIVDGPPMEVGSATCAAPTFVRDLRYGDTRNERGLVLHTVPCDSLHDGTVPLQLSSLSGSKLSAALKAGEASMGDSSTTGLSVVKVVVSDGRPGGLSGRRWHGPAGHGGPRDRAGHRLTAHGRPIEARADALPPPRWREQLGSREWTAIPPTCCARAGSGQHDRPPPR